MAISFVEVADVLLAFFKHPQYRSILRSGYVSVPPSLLPVTEQKDNLPSDGTVAMVSLCLQ